MRAITLFLAGLLASVAATAAPITALVGGRLIDGQGGPPLANSVILVDGERITAIGTVATLPEPAGATLVSTDGMDVLPGLWDMHVHLMINGHADYTHWDKAYLNRFGPEIMPASAVQLLLAGVTSARDLGGPLAESIAIREDVKAGRARASMCPGRSCRRKPIPALKHSAGAWTTRKMRAPRCAS